MYSNHRPMVTQQQQLNSRLIELLDAVKSEFDNVTQEAGMFKMHKDEYEHKTQMQEMQSVRQTVYELELTHQKIKREYEEEISRLRRELESRGAGHVASAGMPGSSGGAQASQAPSQAQQHPPQHLHHQQQLPQHAPPPPQQHAQPQHSSPNQPPALGHGPSNLFGGIMGAGGNLAAPDGVHPGQQPGAQAQQQQQQHQQQQPPQPSSQAPGGNAFGSYAFFQNGKQPSGAPSSSGPYGPGVGAPHVPASPTPSQQQQIKRGKINTNAPQAPLSSEARGSPRVGQTTPPPAPGSSLGDLELDKIPLQSKKEGADWWVIYNPKVPKSLDVELVHSLEHTSVVCCVRFSADGKFVATGCNKSAQIFDAQSGQKVCILQDEGADRDGDLYIRSVCFSPDGKYLATGAEDKQIRIWDIKTRRIRHTFTGHEQDIYSLDFAHNGRHIASGSGDRTARIWDMETGQCMMTLSIEDGVTTVAISPDGRYVAAGSLDKVVRVWDAQSGYLVERLEGHKDSVYSVAFAPNGKDLVSGSLDKTIKLWELGAPRGQVPGSGPKGGVCLRTFHGHKDFVLSVALTPDGAWVVSGSKDRGVQFWNPETALPIFMLQGHKNSVISVSTSPSNGMFATGSGDCRARIWKFSPVS